MNVESLQCNKPATPGPVGDGCRAPFAENSPSFRNLTLFDDGDIRRCRSVEQFPEGLRSRVGFFYYGGKVRVG